MFISFELSFQNTRAEHVPNMTPEKISQLAAPVAGVGVGETWGRGEASYYYTPIQFKENRGRGVSVL